ncbi:MAG TPA: bifunctional aspartate kinase/homoserine dehydrogenase I [Ktedonobacterales bacterium]|nr:bifunctional aspartate kinase/homoserine dehydrogenase I [Ktedonobacterales bacterium]
MRILKFGGSSVGSPERVRAASEIIQRRYQETGGDMLVVISAFQGVTDELCALTSLAAQGSGYRPQLVALERRHLAAVENLLPLDVREAARDSVRAVLAEIVALLGETEDSSYASPARADAITSAGERLSAQIVAASLRAAGLAAIYLDTRPLVLTDDHFGAAHVQTAATYQRIQDWHATLADGRPGGPPLAVATGFIGATADGQTTTLGRGGSDYTAALFGAALNADEIEIWTDVDGVMSADPRAVHDAFTLPALTYAETMELAHFGAKVIFPPTMRPAMAKAIPLRVKNTFNPDGPDTRIAATRPPLDRPITGLTAISDITLLRLEGSGMIGVPGVAQRLFGALARQRINIILVTQASSEHSICLALEPRSITEAIAAIEAEFAEEIAAGEVDPVIIQPDCAIIAVVGESMRQRPGIAGALFSALGQRGVNVIAIAQGSSELNISLVVAREDEARALNAIHDAFFTAHRPEVNIYLAGAGLVGSALLRQMAELAAAPDGDRPRARLRGLLTSARMLLRENGADLAPASARDDLASQGQPADLGAFTWRILATRLPNVTLVDCTASDDLPARYGDLLRAGISVVTPNKRGPAGALALAARDRQVASRSGARYLYETTVGAALPVISALRDLLATGDEVERIEGVLSGTLSYLFNRFDGAQPFSALVRDAQKRGYTEPDPRDDLGGVDVARKLLVLAREIGLPLELGDVSVEPLLSEECLRAPDVGAFYDALARDDERMERQRAEAASLGRALRYIARLEGGAASVELRALGLDSPFARLSGADNMIVFTTRRYHERPLVVQGPGAGAEVTAAGVLADIMRVARSPLAPSALSPKEEM